MERQKFLRRKEASAYLREKFGLERAPSTLAKLAVVGGGPPFQRMNRVPLYKPADLDEWFKSQLGPQIRSTSDCTNGGAATDRFVPECRGGGLTA
jgi:hypothetical protein